jgi:hypothetical protein
MAALSSCLRMSGEYFGAALMENIVSPCANTGAGHIGPLYRSQDKCPVWHSPRTEVSLRAFKRKDVDFAF